MSDVQHIRAKVVVPGRSNYKFQRQLTLDTVCDWIRLQRLDEYTTNGLIELARGYPTQALPAFRKNFNIMIQRVRQKRRKEQNQPETIEEWQEQVPDIVLKELKEVENQDEQNPGE